MPAPVDWPFQLLHHLDALCAQALRYGEEMSRSLWGLDGRLRHGAAPWTKHKRVFLLRGGIISCVLLFLAKLKGLFETISTFWGLQQVQDE